MRMATSSRATSTDTTESPVFSFIPRTPAAARPMGRTSSSLKRMVWPVWLTMKMSSPAGVVLGELRALHLPLTGGEEEVALAREGPGVDDGADALVGRQWQQVDD